jgi:hypothetical protein
MPLRLAEVTGVLLTLGIAAPEKRTHHHLSIRSIDCTSLVRLLADSKGRPIEAPSPRYNGRIEGGP